MFASHSVVSQTRMQSLPDSHSKRKGERKSIAIWLRATQSSLRQECNLYLAVTASGKTSESQLTYVCEPRSRLSNKNAIFTWQSQQAQGLAKVNWHMFASHSVVSQTRVQSLPDSHRKRKGERKSIGICLRATQSSLRQECNRYLAVTASGRAREIQLAYVCEPLSRFSDKNAIFTFQSHQAEGREKVN